MRRIPETLLTLPAAKEVNSNPQFLPSSSQRSSKRRRRPAQQVPGHFSPCPPRLTAVAIVLSGGKAQGVRSFACVCVCVEG